jgi:hypothetical protein
MADGTGTYNWAHMLRITHAHKRERERDLLLETEVLRFQLHMVEDLKFI